MFTKELWGAVTSNGSFGSPVRRSYCTPLQAKALGVPNPTPIGLWTLSSTMYSQYASRHWELTLCPPAALASKLEDTSPKTLGPPPPTGAPSPVLPSPPVVEAAGGGSPKCTFSAGIESAAPRTSTATIAPQAIARRFGAASSSATTNAASRPTHAALATPMTTMATPRIATAYCHQTTSAPAALREMTHATKIDMYMPVATE